MTIRTNELAEPSPKFLTTPARGCLIHVRFGTHQAHKRGGSSVEWGFEPGAFRLRSWNLTTRPQRPTNISVEGRTALLVWAQDTNLNVSIHADVIPV
ncbi:hypothetical protein AVEN_90407-1 [Araneus ventricosus]|uniref:Uncharacterized protein n=1 Tax=Araneus ventricosus TaxID=182803 RepID=A0A4Y2GK30_ARAVE|nr:hypothetical protein AVEN_90407-1 [Araneus ventricosus]